MLQTLADSQRHFRGLARGREGTNQERSIILAGLRGSLSMFAAKAYSSWLMDRVGEEFRQAARRMAWLKRVDDPRAKGFLADNVRTRGITGGSSQIFSNL